MSLNKAIASARSFDWKVSNVFTVRVRHYHDLFNDYSCRNQHRDSAGDCKALNRPNETFKILILLFFLINKSLKPRQAQEWGQEYIAKNSEILSATRNSKSDILSAEILGGCIHSS